MFSLWTTWFPPEGNMELHIGQSLTINQTLLIIFLIEKANNLLFPHFILVTVWVFHRCYRPFILTFYLLFWYVIDVNTFCINQCTWRLNKHFQIQQGDTKCQSKVTSQLSNQHQKRLRHYLTQNLNLCVKDEGDRAGSLNSTLESKFHNHVSAGFLADVVR